MNATDTIRSFSCGHLNVRSLRPKLHEVHMIIEEGRYDIFALSETWLEPEILDEDVALDGYNVYRRDRRGRGGGVCWYVRSGIRCEMIEMVSTIEQLWIRILLKGISISCGVIYRPPNNCPREFLSNMEDSFSQATLLSDEVLCVGDINIDMLRHETPLTLEIVQALEVYGLQQLISEPTRVTESSATLLDVILFSNNDLIVDSGVLHNDISDHLLVYSTFCLESDPIPPIVKTYRDMTYFNTSTFYEYLQSIPWRNIYDIEDIDGKVQFLTSNISILLDLLAPFKTSRFTKPPAPWLTLELRDIIKQRNALNKYKRSKNVAHLNKYKELRNLTTSLLRKSKKHYVESVIQSHSSVKTWKLFKTLKMSRSGHAVLPSHLLDAEGINNYFIQSVPKVINISNQQQAYNSLNKSVKNKLVLRAVSEGEVFKALGDIKSVTCGSDGISVSILSACCPYLLPFLTHLINFCITRSAYPTSWKMAAITPIPKTKNPLLFNDLRPISILPTLSKVLEKLINHQLIKHLNQNNILPACQSAYRAGHGCTTALAGVTDDIFRASDNGFITVLVLLDFTKAFDTVNHALLIQILRHYGLDESALAFFREYLSDRKQYVKLSNHKSSARCLGSGVAQGAILSPTLFSLYTTPLADIFKCCKAHFYADDIQVYISFPPAELRYHMATLNNELSMVSSVAKQHNLVLNPNKSKVMIFGRKRDIIQYRQFVDVVIGGVSVPIVEEARDLGIVLEPDLRFRRHVTLTLSSSYAKLKTIFSSRHLLDIKTKTLLCDSLVLSKFNYADVIYGPCLLKNDEKRIQRVQNSCLRYIYGIRKYDRISHKLLDVGWLNMCNRRVFHYNVFVHKVITLQEPKYLAAKIEFRTDVRHLSLRFRGLVPPMHKTEMFKRSFTYRTIEIYNGWPERMRALGATSFRKEIRKMLLNRQNNSS